MRRLGSHAYALRCLGFVEDAYERGNGIELFGGASAAESAARYGTLPVGPVPPPAGAFVFFACRGVIDGIEGEWGHVGLSLGDGRIVHAWDAVRVDVIADVERLECGPGWTAPRLLGWTPVERLLANAGPGSGARI